MKPRGYSLRPVLTATFEPIARIVHEQVLVVSRSRQRDGLDEGNTMRTIRNKRALVTGAASGIGRAIALALAREGAALFLLDVDRSRLAGVVAEAERHGTDVVGLPCDLACPEEITAAVKTLLRQWGSLDILINNAGVSYHGKTESMPADRWQWLLGINLLAPIQLTCELLPTLLARDEAHIVNVCSILGLVALPRFAAYQVSKFGLVGFSESLRAEYTNLGLGVTALCPGFVRTNIYQAMVEAGHGAKPMSAAPGRFYASPELIAARAVKAIYRNQGLVVVTRLARFLWFVKRVSPRLWDFASRKGKRKQGQRKQPTTATAPEGGEPLSMIP
jgi:NAD(P)-dependent dehydrogenase (short-subunit alcohol dehydrogenase family)